MCTILIGLKYKHEKGNKYFSTYIQMAGYEHSIENNIDYSKIKCFNLYFN